MRGTEVVPGGLLAALPHQEGSPGGDSLYLIGKVLGHRQSRTTERYAHVKDDPVRAVADRTSERIAAIMDGNRATQAVPLLSSKLPNNTAG
jgi:hypothetical protein